MVKSIFRPQPQEQPPADDSLEVVVSIIDISVKGEGIARYGKQVLFIKGALWGEQVAVLLSKASLSSKKPLSISSFRRLKKSPHEKVSPCLSQEICGGCTLMTLQGRSQHLWKQQRLEGLFKRLAGIDQPVLQQASNAFLPIDEASMLSYRHRLRLHCQYKQNAWQLGYFSRQSHALCTWENCLVAWPELKAFIQQVVPVLESLPKEALLQEVTFYHSKEASSGTFLLRTAQSNPKRSDPCWQKLTSLQLPSLQGFVLEGSYGKIPYGKVRLPYDVCWTDILEDLKPLPWPLYYEPGVFTQANPSANAVMLRCVSQILRARLPLQSSKPQKIVETYAGMGNFTLLMALMGYEVTALEGSAEAVALGQVNLAKPLQASAISPKTKLLQANEAEMIEILLTTPQIDALFLDPPRQGSVKLMKIAKPSHQPLIVYVSCDAATFARDAKILLDKGYCIKDLYWVDAFAQTLHMEVLASFVAA